MRLIGIYGGTFDPIHFGHLRPLLEAAQHLNLAQIRFIPCFQTVHKNQPTVSAEQRCEMVRLAIANQPLFKLDLIEIERGGSSYMVDTLRDLKTRFEDESLVLIMGTDAFAKFTSWHLWQEIPQLANILILHRPGELISFVGNEAQLWQQQSVESFSEKNGQLMELPVTQLDISSTQIRTLLMSGDSADYLVPEEVANYISEQKLYQIEN